MSENNEGGIFYSHCM